MRPNSARSWTVIAGLDIDVRTYLEACVGSKQHWRRATDEDIVVRIYGDDWNILRAKAEEVKKALGGIAGITKSEMELPLEEPQVEIEVNMEAAKKYGVKPGDVRRAATTLISGLEVGYLFEQQKVFDVVVWGVPEIRTKPGHHPKPVDRRAERRPRAAEGRGEHSHRAVADRRSSARP